MRADLALLDTRHSLGLFLDKLVFNTGLSMVLLMTLVLLRMATRSRLAAVVSFVLLWTAVWGLMAPHTIWGWLLLCGVAMICAYLLVQVGFLALVIGASTYSLLAVFPLTLEMTDWKAGATLFVLAMMGLMTVGGLIGVRRRCAPGTSVAS